MLIWPKPELIRIVARVALITHSLMSNTVLRITLRRIRFSSLINVDTIRIIKSIGILATNKRRRIFFSEINSKREFTHCLFYRSFVIIHFNKSAFHYFIFANVSDYQLIFSFSSFYNLFS